MNKFDKANTTASALNLLVSLAEAHFGSSPLLGEARVTLDGGVGVEVHVQMTEANVLHWCAVNGVALPPSTVAEMDYTSYGGGFMTHRRLLVEVATVAAGGRLVLVSCETLSTRPGPAQAESNESEAVA